MKKEEEKKKRAWLSNISGEGLNKKQLRLEGEQKGTRCARKCVAWTRPGIRKRYPKEPDPHTGPAQQGLSDPSRSPRPQKHGCLQDKPGGSGNGQGRTVSEARLCSQEHLSPLGARQSISGSHEAPPLIPGTGQGVDHAGGTAQSGGAFHFVRWCPCRTGDTCLSPVLLPPPCGGTGWFRVAGPAPEPPYGVGGVGAE